MALKLDRMAIEEAGASPARLAQAIVAQIPGLVPPVPVHEIALALDIEQILEEPLTSIEGCLLTDHNKGYGRILVNASSGYRRRRFTVGHELGHFLNAWHKPTQDTGFVCTRDDMTTPKGPQQHERQEREANAFAIELLTPRTLLRSHLSQAAELEHALAIAERFDISREAAARRYVELHAERLALVFTAGDRIRYVVKSNEFPHLACWTGDVAPERPLRPRDGSDLSDLDEVGAHDWIARPSGLEVFAQTLYQAKGYSMTLLVCEGSESG